MKHTLIPEHKKMSENEKKDLLEKYGVTLKQLPNINVNDPALEKVTAKVGDVIKIERSSPTAGRTIFYRSVI